MEETNNSKRGGVMKCRRCGAKLDHCEEWDMLCIDCMHDNYMDDLLSELEEE